MIPTYLAGLIVRGQQCLVFGDSTELHTHVRRLLQAEARVRWINSGLTEEQRTAFLSLARPPSRLEFVDHETPPIDWSEVRLVIDGRHDEARTMELTSQLSPGCWVLAMDQPRHCNIIGLATVSRGPLQLAVSTSGLAPSLSAKLRRVLDEQLGDDLAAFVEQLAAYRASLDPASRRQQMRVLLESFEMKVDYSLPSVPRPDIDRTVPTKS